MISELIGDKEEVALHHREGEQNMHEIIAKVQTGLNTIIFFMVLAGILSIGAFLFERHRLRDSDLSEEAKRYSEKLAAVAVFGFVGVIMIFTLWKMNS